VQKRASACETDLCQYWVDPVGERSLLYCLALVCTRIITDDCWVLWRRQRQHGIKSDDQCQWWQIVCVYGNYANGQWLRGKGGPERGGANAHRKFLAVEKLSENLLLVGKFSSKNPKFGSDNTHRGKNFRAKLKFWTSIKISSDRKIATSYRPAYFFFNSRRSSKRDDLRHASVPYWTAGKEGRISGVVTLIHRVLAALLQT